MEMTLDFEKKFTRRMSLIMGSILLYMPIEKASDVEAILDSIEYHTRKFKTEIAEWKMEQKAL
jgi:capsule polysaccharide export protein KpsC/LpsZ